jgi:general secretion pathway protein G
MQRRRWGRLYRTIALMILMAIISIAVSITVPIYQKSRMRAKESLLKRTLFAMRTVLHEYAFDKKKAPRTLRDLVSEGYLRAVPLDSITGSDKTWVPVMEDPLTAVDQTQPGIRDVHSGSSQNSLEGPPYSQSPPW